ncbi:MAG TPA: Hsp70 family protein, partial [Stellaceae bacterium]|nr:Hsp70 family protein [Stellaceae bacterium]
NGGYADGQFLPVIERNTLLPASRSQTISSVADNQTRFVIEIYQGESRLVADNIKLGEVTIPLPPGPSGKEAAEVRFTYDVSGLLDIDVKVISTGATARLVIEENPGAMSQGEIEKRLKAMASLKIAPREMSENRALLARAERLYEESLGEQREALAQAILAFETMLATQRPEAIEAGRATLARLIERIDRDTRL